MIREARSTAVGVRLSLACVLLAWLFLALPAQADVIVLKQAQASITPKGGTARTEAVVLPYGWDETEGLVEGQARFVLALDLADPAQPTALYMPRIGSTFQLTLNGVEVAHFGQGLSDPHADASRQPRFVELPQHLLAPHNRLEFAIGVNGALGAGLSPVVAGPRDEVFERYRSTRLWQGAGSRLVAIVSAVLGLLALLVWLRRREPLFLYYGLGELAWSLQTARVLFDHAPFGLPWTFWGIVVTTSFHAAPALLCKFALAVVGRGDGLLGRAMNVLLWLALPASLLWLVSGFVWIGPLERAAAVLVGVSMTVVVVRSAWRSRVREEQVLAAAALLVVVCGVRDVLMLKLSGLAFDIVPWSRFSWVGFAVVMAWVIAERMRKDSLALGAMNERLNEQLAIRNAELAAAFERERENEKKSGALEERQRLVRDLHDGLGGHLVGALRMAQQEGAASHVIAQQLREAVDQLRITVDSMHDNEGDVSAALAAVRYRLAPRLQAAGIDLQWDVDELPSAAHWGVREAHHLQMLLYEAFTNMIVHSGATRARLLAHHEGPAEQSYVRISLSDNGRGFDTAAAAARGGRGLANMRKRALALGARFELRSAAQDTRLELELPLQPAAAGS
jgi:signal transduction histidine kinase